jgi:hypothetical protein
MNKEQFILLCLQGIYKVLPCTIVRRGTKRHYTFISVLGSELEVDNGSLAELPTGLKERAREYNEDDFCAVRISHI